MRAVRLVVVLASGAALAAALACGQGTRPAAGGDKGSPGGFATLSGPCTTEGAVHDCHVNLGEKDGVIDCFAGVQECRNGAWTTCGGRDITLSSVDTKVAPAFRAGAGGLSTLAVAVTDAGVCSTDPCDPYCVAFNLDAGLQAEAGVATYVISGNEWGNAPGGFVGKQDCTSPGCSAASGFPHDCNGAPTHYNTFDACQADHHCDTSVVAAGTCERNSSPLATWTWPAALCPGVDLTVSPACQPTAASEEQFMICNWGNTALASGTAIPIFIDTGNGYDFGGGAATCYNKAASCTKTLAAALSPGNCVAVKESECAAWGSGNKIAYVNSNQSIAECTSASAAGTAATQPGCNNNWSDIKKGGNLCVPPPVPFVPTTIVESYTAICPPASTVTWKNLTYNAVINCSPGACSGANNSSITFKGQLTDLPLGSPTPAVPSTITTVTTTTNCTVSGPAGCPVSLAAWAGMPNATFEVLTLTIVLTPSPNTLASPKLGTWAVSYDCVPNE